MQTKPSQTHARVDEAAEVFGEILPRVDSVQCYVCDECRAVAGYYPSSYVVIDCPHCGNDAHRTGRPG